MSPLEHINERCETRAGRCGLASEARSGGSVRPDDVFLTDRGDARSVMGMTCRILHL